MIKTPYEQGKQQVQNAPERTEYYEALQALVPVLRNLPSRIVAIDGKSGVGKTTLGRFLAWRFNVTLLETDLFLIPAKGALKYYMDGIDRAIQSRLDELPIIVEGVVSLRILKELGHSVDYHIHVVCEEAGEVEELSNEIRAYERTFDPMNNANLVLNLPVED